MNKLALMPVVAFSRSFLTPELRCRTLQIFVSSSPRSLTSELALARWLSDASNALRQRVSIHLVQCGAITIFQTKGINLPPLLGICWLNRWFRIRIFAGSIAVGWFEV